MQNTITDFKYNPEIAPQKSLFNPDIHKTWYKYNYAEIFQNIKDGNLPKRETFVELIKNDLFFIAYFVANWEGGNKPFIVERCHEIESGPQTGNVDIWSREHGKSTLLNRSLTVKRIVNDPECTTAIFSYKAGAAQAHMDSTRKILELPIMKWAFPDICWQNTNESTSWSLQGGIRVKRQNTVRPEHTVQAFGLVEGMPTGGHWDHLIFDDVETDDMAQSPDQLELCFNKLQMAYNLGREGGTANVIGTFYSHCGVLTRLQEMKDIYGNPMYNVRIFPGTDDGTITGKPVFFSQEYLDSKKTRPGFSTQILCNPTPGHEKRLYFDRFKMVRKAQLPARRAKIIVIDTAGDAAVQIGKKNDNWAMLCLSVDLNDRDDLGLRNIYLEDAIVSKLTISAAVDAACRLYMRNSIVSIIGIEQAGQSTQYNDIRSGLKARGVYIEVKGSGNPYGNMILLSPGNKAKEVRIENNISWSLNNGKLHIVEDSVSPEVVAALKNECERFPFFHVDILDALAYLFNILADKTVTLLPCRHEVESGMKPEKKPTGRSAMCA